RYRADGDDAAARVRHRTRSRLAHQERAAQIDGDNPVEKLGWCLQKRLVRTDPGAVHEHVDPLEPRAYGRDETRDAAGVAHVELMSTEVRAGGDEARLRTREVGRDRLGAFAR